jgi:hypothetical protein
MSLRRRYEILIPLQFNESQNVPDSLVWQTIEELEAGFGAVSWESQVIRGMWQHEGIVFRDNNSRLVLDVEDTPENRVFFVELKASLKQRFQQIDILDHQPAGGCTLAKVCST